MYCECPILLTTVPNIRNRCLGQMALTDQQLPASVLEQVADALLFYVRGFRCLDMGTPSERFVPSSRLSDDLGGRALAALEALGEDVRLAAMRRMDETQ